MFSFKLLCILLTVSLCSRGVQSEKENRLNFIWDSLFNFNKKNDQDSAKTSNSMSNTKCITCSNKLEEELSIEEELTKLRIEFIKQQILKKLRLKEKPSVSLPIGGLPKPLVEDGSLFPRNQENQAEQDHYYGKTTQAIIFPYDGMYLTFFCYSTYNCLCRVL